MNGGDSGNIEDRNLVGADTHDFTVLLVKLLNDPARLPEVDDSKDPQLGGASEERSRDLGEWVRRGKQAVVENRGRERGKEDAEVQQRAQDGLVQYGGGEGRDECHEREELGWGRLVALEDGVRHLQSIAGQSVGLRCQVRGVATHESCDGRNGEHSTWVEVLEVDHIHDC